MFTVGDSPPRSRHDERLPSSIVDRFRELPPALRSPTTAMAPRQSRAPERGERREIPVKITATNSSWSAVQSFTLTVTAATHDHERCLHDLDRRSAGNFTVTATGSPTPTITRQEPFPLGSRSPPQPPGPRRCPAPRGPRHRAVHDQAPRHQLVRKDQPDVHDPVDQPPTITSAPPPARPPAPRLASLSRPGVSDRDHAETGTLPAGVTFKSDGNGTATIGGTAPAGTATIPMHRRPPRSGSPHRHSRSRSSPTRAHPRRSRPSSARQWPQRPPARHHLPGHDRL